MDDLKIEDFLLQRNFVLVSAHTFNILSSPTWPDMNNLSELMNKINCAHSGEEDFSQKSKI